MADQGVSVSNFPDSGSAERVAHDLYRALRGNMPAVGNEAFNQNVGRHLALYVQCLKAAKLLNYDTSKLT